MKKDKLILILSNLIISIILLVLFKNINAIIFNSFGMLFILAFLKTCDSKLYKHINIIYIVCVVAMLLLYFGYTVKYNQPYYLGGSDDLNFEIWAKQAIESGNFTIADVNNNPLFHNYNCNGFIWFLSLIMRFSNCFGGYHAVLLRIINIYFLISIGLMIYKYFNSNENKKSTIGLLYAVTLFPNMLFVSINGFRDITLTFLIFSIFYLTNNLIKRKLSHKITIISYIVLTTYIAYNIREEAILYIILIIILNLLFNNTTLNELKNDKKIIKFLSNKKNILISLMFCVVTFILLLEFGFFREIQGYINRYNGYILEGDPGLSAYVFKTPFFPFGFILRILYGLIFPSPTGMFIRGFEVDEIVKLLLSVGTIIQIYLLPYLFKNIKRIDKIVIIYVTVFSSIIFTTFGFRHFVMLYPFMFILIFRQLVNTNKTERRKLFKLISILMILGFTFYSIYKLI